MKDRVTRKNEGTLFEGTPEEVVNWLDMRQVWKDLSVDSEASDGQMKSRTPREYFEHHHIWLAGHRLEIDRESEKCILDFEGNELELKRPSDIATWLDIRPTEWANFMVKVYFYDGEQHVITPHEYFKNMGYSLPKEIKEQENLDFLAEHGIEDRYRKVDFDTEVILRGKDLRTGMVVLAENWGERNETAGLVDLSDQLIRKTMKLNRWCQVRDPRQYQRDAYFWEVSFIGEYDDGDSMLRSQEISQGWIVKRNSIPTDEGLAKAAKTIKSVGGMLVHDQKRDAEVRRLGDISAEDAIGDHPADLRRWLGIGQNTQDL